MRVAVTFRLGFSFWAGITDSSDALLWIQDPKGHRTLPGLKLDSSALFLSVYLCAFSEWKKIWAVWQIYSRNKYVESWLKHILITFFLEVMVIQDLREGKKSPAHKQSRPLPTYSV